MANVSYFISSVFHVSLFRDPLFAQPGAAPLTVSAWRVHLLWAEGPRNMFLASSTIFSCLDFIQISQPRKSADYVQTRHVFFRSQDADQGSRAPTSHLCSSPTGLSHHGMNPFAAFFTPGSFLGCSFYSRPLCSLP